MNDYFLAHTYIAITVLMILTGAGLPLPEEVFIVTAGVLSATPDANVNPFIALGCCLFGALVGDCVMYWIGYHFGRGVLRDRRWFSRWVTPEREEHIEEMFHLHGLKVFFVARFLVGLRTPVYLTAGILRLSFKKFVLIDLVCAAAVVSSFFGLAYYFGANISKWIRRGELGTNDQRGDRCGLCRFLSVAAVSSEEIGLTRQEASGRRPAPPGQERAAHQQKGGKGIG